MCKVSLEYADMTLEKKNWVCKEPEVCFSNLYQQ